MGCVDSKEDLPSDESAAKVPSTTSELAKDRTKVRKKATPKGSNVDTVTKKLPLLQLTEEDQAGLTQQGYSVQEPFNSGEFGVVYKATRYVHHNCAINATAQKCAAKVIDLSKLSQEQIDLDLSREIFMLNRVKHPHVVSIYDMFRADPLLLIIFMELAEGGDLGDLMADCGSIEESLAVNYYRQFGDALRYMHSIGYAHRDMKLENVLLNKDRTVTKVADFGFSRPLYDPVSGKRAMAKTWCGTVAYMPPEMLEMAHSYCPMKADVWSTGVLLYVLLNDDFPFDDNDETLMVQLQKERNYQFSKKTLTKLAKQVIELHLVPRYEQRPTIDDILQHDWFKEHITLQ